VPQTIFVSNCNEKDTSEDVTSIFSKYGTVEKVDMKLRYAFVYMPSLKDADYAVKQVKADEKLRHLRVEFTRGDGAVKKREQERQQIAKNQPSTTLFVVGFDPDVTRTKDLEDIFFPFGTTSRVEIKRNFAFVEYHKLEDAVEAREKMHNTKLAGRMLVVEYQARVPTAPPRREVDRGGRRVRDREPSRNRDRPDRDRDRTRDRRRSRSPRRDREKSRDRRSPKPRHSARSTSRDRDRRRSRDRDRSRNRDRSRDRRRSSRDRDRDRDRDRPRFVILPPTPYFGVFLLYGCFVCAPVCMYACTPVCTSVCSQVCTCVRAYVRVHVYWLMYFFPKPLNLRSYVYWFARLQVVTNMDTRMATSHTYSLHIDHI